MSVATKTQPDVSFDACRMSNTGKSPKEKLQFKANKSLLRSKFKTGSLCFLQLRKHANYSDAIYASLDDGSTQSSIFVCSRMNRVTPICWSLKKKKKIYRVRVH